MSRRDSAITSIFFTKLDRPSVSYLRFAKVGKSSDFRNSDKILVSLVLGFPFVRDCVAIANVSGRFLIIRFPFLSSLASLFSIFSFFDRTGYKRRRFDHGARRVGARTTGSNEAISNRRLFGRARYRITNVGDSLWFIAGKAYRLVGRNRASFAQEKTFCFHTLHESSSTRFSLLKSTWPFPVASFKFKS